MTVDLSFRALSQSVRFITRFAGIGNQPGCTLEGVMGVFRGFPLRPRVAR